MQDYRGSSAPRSALPIEPVRCVQQTSHFALGNVTWPDDTPSPTSRLLNEGIGRYVRILQLGSKRIGTASEFFTLARTPSRDRVGDLRDVVDQRPQQVLYGGG